MLLFWTSGVSTGGSRFCYLRCSVLLPTKSCFCYQRMPALLPRACCVATGSSRRRCLGRTELLPSWVALLLATGEGSADVSGKVFIMSSLQHRNSFFCYNFLAVLLQLHYMFAMGSPTRSPVSSSASSFVDVTDDFHFCYISTFFLLRGFRQGLRRAQPFYFFF